MNLRLLDELCKSLCRDDMNLIYSGDFSDDITDKVIGLGGKPGPSDEKAGKLHRKTGFLIAECFQNIVRHHEAAVEDGFFMVRHRDGSMIVTSGNAVAKNSAGTLADTLDHLNSLSQAELKELYLRSLTDNSMSNKGGAGLGLIEMARKSGNKLKFSFDDSGPDHSYFYFRLKLDMNPGEGCEETAEIEECRRLRKIMLENHLFLVYCGDISMDTIIPIFEMVEKSLAVQSTEQSELRKVCIVLTEFLQNMSNQGALEGGKQQGLFIMGKKDGRLLVGGMNELDSGSKKKLESKLMQFAAADKDVLDASYDKLLREGDTAGESDAKIGRAHV